MGRVAVGYEAAWRRLGCSGYSPRHAAVSRAIIDFLITHKPQPI
jgi:hypothetical protein